MKKKTLKTIWIGTTIGVAIVTIYDYFFGNPESILGGITIWILVSIVVAMMYDEKVRAEKPNRIDKLEERVDELESTVLTEQTGGENEL